ncbi:MAG: hypothetical protein JSS66_02000 [Armatimonadetes bacterium]|nr:hypothetical protein [Armatimonadota bacterium]
MVNQQSIDLFNFIKLSCGVLATIGLYSVLYKETKFFRFFEHIFLGLAAGYAMVALWKETLYPQWWLKMVGQLDDKTHLPATPGYWVYIVLLPIGLLGYFVFSKKHNWLSRVPIGIILGLWAGQQVQIWWQTYGPQLYASMQPVFPTTWSSFVKPVTTGAGYTPEQIALINSNIYPSQALNNLIFVVTLLAAFTYFIYSFELKTKFLAGFNRMGRWMLMIGFGAIFGSTVMARFALVIDRMFYIWIEWVTSLQHLSGR